MAELRAAIDRLTRAIATVHDDALAALVAERRALREELRAMSDDDDILPARLGGDGS